MNYDIYDISSAQSAVHCSNDVYCFFAFSRNVFVVNNRLTTGRCHSKLWCSWCTHFPLRPFSLSFAFIGDLWFSTEQFPNFHGTPEKKIKIRKSTSFMLFSTRKKKNICVCRRRNAIFLAIGICLRIPSTFCAGIHRFTVGKEQFSSFVFVRLFRFTCSIVRQPQNLLFPFLGLFHSYVHWFECERIQKKIDCELRLRNLYIFFWAQISFSIVTTASIIFIHRRERSFLASLNSSHAHGIVREQIMIQIENSPLLPAPNDRSSVHCNLISLSE